MKIIDFTDDIKIGCEVAQSDLTSAITSFFYLRKVNIQNNIAITERDAKYLHQKNYNKIKSSAAVLEYGDCLVYRDGDEKFQFLYYRQDFTKTIIPSIDFIIIKSPKALLNTILRHSVGEKYILDEFKIIEEKGAKSMIDFLEKIKVIEIDNTLLEDEDLRNYIPPGSLPISREDIQKIDVRSGSISIFNLMDSLRYDEIRLEGYFQRKTDLWDNDVKSRLIETIWVGIPIPPLYFDKTNIKNWLVIDGLQRISAIRAFVENELVLEGLEYLIEFEGKRHSDLELHEQRSFGRNMLGYFAIYQGTPRSVRYRIFKSINVSALILNRQEIRYAINEDEQQAFTPSRFTKQLGEIVTNFINIPAKGKERSIERMYDRELALRYIAFCIFNYKTDYTSMPFPDFLDKAMEAIYTCKQPKLNQIKENLGLALDTLCNIFDNEILFKRKMIDEKDTNNVISGALFDVFTYTIAELSIEQQIILQRKKDTFIKEVRLLKNNDKFMKAIDSRHSESIGSVKDKFSILQTLIHNTITQ